MPDTYEFRISGQLSHDLLASFEPQMSSCEADETVFVRLIEDSGELFGVIARCELLGLRLVGLRQLSARVSAGLGQGGTRSPDPA